MKVRIADLKDKTLHLEAEEPIGDYPDLIAMAESGECEFLAPLRLDFTVAREFDHIRAAGRVETLVKVPCARCLTNFQVTIDSSFTVFYTKSVEPLDEEVELAEEDLISKSYEGEEIDFAPEVAEQVILEIPFKPLCREDCKGLCSNCGANLNDTACSCDRSEGSFKFNALKGLKIDK
ncbi:DUF177 domain-containing protein [Geotalea sp. SG265]|uniref:YceD family protein n=1 Tax=Geotalea sp. SG265 TaxID=2922867 RepID=UPI001FAEABE9|nr:DUF177 domain-containing protein [Geotalea sp. SG265]